MGCGMHAELRRLIDSKVGPGGHPRCPCAVLRHARAGALRHSTPNRRERKPLLVWVAVASMGAVLG